jgi:hypothetical protein
MKKSLFNLPAGLFLVSLWGIGLALGQSNDEVLTKSEIVSKNIQTAISVHLQTDPNFRVTNQSPTDPQPEPKMLEMKNGTFRFSWTEGQHARYLMESLRQGVHALQSADKPLGLDAVALSGAREFWPKLRDISCHEFPGSRYYGLDGFEQFCPTK